MRKFAAVGLALALALATPAYSQPSVNSTEGMDQLVAIDSQGWMFNRYDVGSMHGVRVIDRSSDGAQIVVYGEYTYNGGAPGWVKAHFDNGQFSCLEFWDFPGRCRGLGQSPSRAIVAGILSFAVSAASAPPRGSYRSSNDNSNQYDPSQDPRNYQPDSSSSSSYDPPPPPTPPIGGDNGLYGCASPPCM